MSVASSLDQFSLQTRVRQSLGASNIAIYEMVARALAKRQASGDLIVDIGCGVGNLFPFVSHMFSRYVGVDAVRYTELPDDVEFHSVDLDTGKAPLPENIADAVVAVETIEHLENPRALMRELVRLAKPNGWVIITTPNQLSLLSLLTLLLKHRFTAFQEADYPAHLTALLEIDLQRIATECRLTELSFAYSLRGRLILTPYYYPQFLSRLFPRELSDNILLMGRKLND
ncbi:MAG TPA: methyltransferase domain-containing protein [Pyrinomonadaceae bacterium]|jgi:SAM-dependent methyltransferase